jgi:hypothetical protein
MLPLSFLWRPGPKPLEILEGGKGEKRVKRGKRGKGKRERGRGREFCFFEARKKVWTKYNIICFIFLFSITKCHIISKCLHKTKMIFL